MILAAGKATRLGYTKALLRFQGQTLLYHIAKTCSAAGVDPILVVHANILGPTTLSQNAAQFALGQIPNSGICKYLPGISNGQLIDSIRAVLWAVPTNHALFVWPVDCPFASATLLSEMLVLSRKCPDNIISPRVGNKSGHPILFGPHCVQEITSSAADGGVHDLLRHIGKRRSFVDAADERLVESINTPADMQRLAISPPSTSR